MAEYHSTAGQRADSDSATPSRVTQDLKVLARHADATRAELSARIEHRLAELVDAAPNPGGLSDPLAAQLRSLLARFDQVEGIAGEYLAIEGRMESDLQREGLAASAQAILGIELEARAVQTRIALIGLLDSEHAAAYKTLSFAVNAQLAQRFRDLADEIRRRRTLEYGRPEAPTTDELFSWMVGLAEANPQIMAALGSPEWPSALFVGRTASVEATR